MQSVTVSKKDLLERLETNREKHTALFKEADEGYRGLVIQHMEKNLAAAKDGGPIELYIRLEAPQDHTEDYDNVIEMVRMSIDDEIELEAHDFQQYVLDKWQWANKQTLQLLGTYAESAKTIKASSSRLR